MASTGPARGARHAPRCARSSLARAMPWTTRGTLTARLEQAFAAGDLVPHAVPDQALGDLAVALEQDEGQKLGGKSAEASRFILRAIDRELDEA